MKKVSQIYLPATAAMRKCRKTLTMAGLLLGLSLMAAPQKENPQTPQNQAVVKQSDVKIGEEFKISNISGTEVAVTIVERAGTHYIRSTYHHGWTSEIRQYVVSNNVASAWTRDRTICVSFPRKPKRDPIGAVYVINNHGEAVKVDDITVTDLTW
jgi:hypothetical protein